MDVLKNKDMKKIFEFILAHGTGYLPESIKRVVKNQKKEVATPLSVEARKFASMHMTSFVPK